MTTAPRLKRCIKCHQSKQITEFYKHPSATDGVEGMCKECKKRKRRRSYQKASPKPQRLKKMTDATTKRCSKCQQTKNLNDFSIDKSISDGHRPDCKKCFNARRRTSRPSRRKPAKKQQARQLRRQCLRCSKRKWPSAYCAHSRRPDRLTQLCQACHTEIAIKEEYA